MCFSPTGWPRLRISPSIRSTICAPACTWPSWKIRRFWKTPCPTRERASSTRWSWEFPRPARSASDGPKCSSVALRAGKRSLKCHKQQPMHIHIDHLKKHYGRTRAVDDVSFTFSSGEIVGFVGPNGAGKSTTMRIIATLEEPTSGDVFLDGISVVEEPDKAHRLIGYVPDTLPSHRDISVHEYLDFFARAYGIGAATRKKVVESIEEFTNLLGIRDKPLNALSKGMKNRVSVARALVHDPAVLIMDEPAAGLDPRARIELRELLKVLSGQGKAILISS